MILMVPILLGFGSCGIFVSNTAILWTDRPEFAFYAQYFNISQSRYKVEVRYFESPSRRLTESSGYPDIVAASWLKSSSTRSSFRPISGIISREARASFYPQLLSMGHIDRRQRLLPVSFNIPAIIFAQNISDPPLDPFTIELEEIRERARAHNVSSGGEYTRMGFNFSASEEFLFITATLFGAGFREASPIAWDSQALEQSLAWAQRWITEVNTSVHAEDDFAYKYFFDPPEKQVNSGRVLYSYMDSARFFTLPEEHRVNLDFRWLAANSRIPVDERAVYLGIHKRARARKAAEAFTRWFFQAETQGLLLEAGRGYRLHESSFGIAGGFSSMRTVTEQIFPHFYPSLFGRLPPQSYLFPANILPRNWISVKERVILPYLGERIRLTSRENIRPLEWRIADWYRLNRE